MKHRYLLDTNVVSEMARHPSGPIAIRIGAIGEDTVCTSVVVACEIHYGLIKRASAPLTKRVMRVLESMDVLVDFPGDTAEHYGRIRAHLESIGRPIGPNDLLIAAHARAAGLTLVTRNVREFSRVPDLAVEDWSLGADAGTN